MSRIPSVASAEPDFWSPKVLVPFILVALIWGSTWLVIKDQISSVPPSWSITYRFIVAAIGMFALAWFRGQLVKLTRAEFAIAFGLGLFQFMANFNFVYRAEAYVTSGLIAVLFAMLMVPNAIFARIFLGQRITSTFLLGTGVALCGIALLFVQEYRAMPAGVDGIAAGIGFALGGLIAASIANVMQSAERARRLPMLCLLAWAMLWGVAFDGAFAFITSGPPVIETRLAYLGGIAYLGILGSVVTFPLYFNLIRQIGAAKAAYSGVLVPVVAMVLSTIFEGYRWSPLAIGGAALGIVGMLIAMWARKPRTPRVAAS